MSQAEQGSHQLLPARKHRGNEGAVSRSCGFIIWRGGHPGWTRAGQQASALMSRSCEVGTRYREHQESEVLSCEEQGKGTGGG